MVGVEQWAEIRRLHYAERVAIREIVRRTGLARATVRRALRTDEPPRYQRAPAPSKLEPHKPEIHRLLRAEPAMPARRVRELTGELGYSLDPALVGRRVEVRVGQAEISATALDGGALVARHRRSYARHRTITDPAHQAALVAVRTARAEPAVERWPLARYDELIPA